MSTEIINSTCLAALPGLFASATSHSLVIFDVVSVLLMPTSKANRQILTAIKNHPDYSAKQKEKLSSSVLISAPITLVETGIIDILASFQQRAIKVIGLTSGHTGRYGDIERREDFRITRLAAAGIDFSQAFPAMQISLASVSGASYLRCPLFKSGIIFTCRLSKGRVLKEFLSQIDFKPEKIIFVDDRLANLQSVAEYCQKAGLEFCGVHYAPF